MDENNMLRERIDTDDVASGDGAHQEGDDLMTVPLVACNPSSKPFHFLLPGHGRRVRKKLPYAISRRRHLRAADNYPFMTNGQFRILLVLVLLVAISVVLEVLLVDRFFLGPGSQTVDAINADVFVQVLSEPLKQEDVKRKARMSRNSRAAFAQRIRGPEKAPFEKVLWVSSDKIAGTKPLARLNFGP